MINTPTVVINARVTLPIMLYQMKVAIATITGTNQPGQALWWCFGTLRLLNQFHNLGKKRIFTYRVVRNLKLPDLLIVAPIT